ncbi:protein kinase [Patescibacteria group bacterium]|nr:protein kinase [Patescibacteria group bacterium]
MYDEELDFIGEGVFGKVFKGTKATELIRTRTQNDRQTTTNAVSQNMTGEPYVSLGTCRQCSVAVKVPRNQQLSTTELNDLRREVAIMRYAPFMSSIVLTIPLSQIFHPNVVLFMGACTQPGNIKIVTEKMMTDMEKFLRTTKAQQMQPFMRFTMALDAAKGLLRRNLPSTINAIF